MSEELYLQWEMKYRGGSMKKAVEEARKEERYKLARCMLKRGLSVEAVEQDTAIPRDDLLRMQAELNGTPA